MTNYLLFVSSLGIGLVQLITIAYFRPPTLFCVLAFAAFVTSTWNHGTTQHVAKFLDRTYMIIYIISNAAIILTVVKDVMTILVMYSIMASGIYCVVVARIKRETAPANEVNNPYKLSSPGNFLHLYAHVVVMIVHTLLSYRLQLTQDCHDRIPLVCTDNWLFDIFTNMKGITWWGFS